MEKIPALYFSPASPDKKAHARRVGIYKWHLLFHEDVLLRACYDTKLHTVTYITDKTFTLLSRFHEKTLVQGKNIRLGMVSLHMARMVNIISLHRLAVYPIFLYVLKIKIYKRYFDQFHSAFYNYNNSPDYNLLSHRRKTTLAVGRKKG